MKLGVMADVHVGNHKVHGGMLRGGLNTRARLVVESFARALQRCYERGCNAVVIAGDLFDVCYPSPPMVREVMDAIESVPGSMRVHVMRGNHDTYSFDQFDHALAALGTVCDVVTEPRVLRLVGAEVLLVPYLKGPPAVWLGRVAADLLAVRQPVQPPRLLCMHMGIKDEHTAPWLRESEGAIDVERLAAIAAVHGIHAVASGDWHEQRIWPAHHTASGCVVGLRQVGALVPTGWDNAGSDYGHVMEWTSESPGDVSCGFQVAGPRFDTFKRVQDAVAWAHEQRAMMCTPFVRVEAPAERVEDERRTAGVLACGHEYVLEVVSDGKAERVAAESAARAARVAVSADEAVHEYVDRMSLPDGVDRGRVRSHTVELLNEAEKRDGV